MELHGIPIGSIWTVIKSLPAFFLQRFFPKDKLAALVYVDLRPRHDSATVDLGEGASFNIWLNVINLSPFEIELDRAEFQFWCGGTAIKESILKKQSISPGEIATIQISGLIPDGHANQMARTYLSSNASIDGLMNGYIEFNCKLHPFCKNVANLSGIKPRVINESLRVKKITA